MRERNAFENVLDYREKTNYHTEPPPPPSTLLILMTSRVSCVLLLASEEWRESEVEFQISPAVAAALRDDT